MARSHISVSWKRAEVTESHVFKKIGSSSNSDQKQISGIIKNRNNPSQGRDVQAECQILNRHEQRHAHSGEVVCQGEGWWGECLAAVTALMGDRAQHESIRGSPVLKPVGLVNKRGHHLDPNRFKCQITWPVDDYPQVTCVYPHCGWSQSKGKRGRRGMCTLQDNRTVPSKEADMKPSSTTLKS